jgi:dGTPase
VAAAALAHDLGNPPFGHSGEDAIRHWFETSPIARVAREELDEAQQADIARYEGNAQGFRLITRLQMPDNPGGLQLTAATLGAFTKYPRESVVPEVRALGYTGASAKKFGFFQSEREHFSEIAARCGLIPRVARGGWWARHPLAFLVEAADDICYRLVDFEDGFRVRELSYEEVAAHFLAIIDDPAKRQWRDSGTEKRRVQILRDFAIGCAIDDAVRTFLENEDAILAGTFDTPLIDAGPKCAAWAAIQQRSGETIYSTTRGVEIEAAGFEVLGGLLDIFVSALNDFERHPKRSNKLLRLVPAESLGPGRAPDADPYERLLKMLDFVSGMTDRYAVSLYKKVRGISLPGR